MNVPVEKIRMLLEATRDPVSLDSPVGDEGGATVGDFVEDLSFPAPDDALGDNELSRETRELLKLLSPREEQVLRMRFGIDSPGRSDARGGRQELRADARAHPADRDEGAAQAAPPLVPPEAEGSHRSLMYRARISACYLHAD